MLVVSRRKNEWIRIGHGKDTVRLVVVGIIGRTVRLGFDADPTIPIHREEVARSIAKGEREGGAA